MLFNSFEFLLLFLPLTLGLALLLKGRALLSWIGLCSFVFYTFAGHAWFIVPMLMTTVLDFVLAQRIEAAETKRSKTSLLLLSLVGNLGLLVYFKYSGLLARSALALLGLMGMGNEQWLSVFEVILPAGISFYTFQTLSYIIDVYRGEARAERDFIKFACFVSFFPHLVAGPLTRHNQLLPGLERISRLGIRPKWEDGIYLFATGLAKKVLIADRIGGLIDPALGDIATLGWQWAWLAMVGYALQIYFDFSGYSDMAIGLGRLFGIELPQNFDSPYKAVNPSDFWKRWHITLSRWLRDYLYISLGGNRCSPRRRDFNLVATMVLGGLWHGASWTFAAWGFYHGLLLVVYRLVQDRWERLPMAIQRGAMFLLVCVGWVFFRASTFGEASTWFAALVGLNGRGTYALGADAVHLAALVTAGLVIVNVFGNASTFAGFSRMPRPMQAALGILAAAAVVFMNYSSKFLYFQF